MILKSVNNNKSLTLKWIYPLLLYHNKELAKELKTLNIIGVAIGDLKHNIVDNLIIVVDNRNNDKDSVYKKITDLIPDSYNYSYFNNSNAIKIIVFPFDLIPNGALDCIFKSDYSALYDIYKYKINSIYPYNVVSIILKNKNVVNNFIVSTANNLDIDEDNIKPITPEIEFDSIKELLWLVDDIEDINIKNLFKSGKNKLLTDLKEAIKDKTVLDKFIITYDIQISKELCKILIKYLELPYAK